MDEMPGQFGRSRQRQPQSWQAQPSFARERPPYEDDFASQGTEPGSPRIAGIDMQRVMRFLRGPFVGASCLAICLAFCSIGSVGAIAVGVHTTHSDAVYATVAARTTPTAPGVATGSGGSATTAPGQQQSGQQQQPAPSNTLTLTMTCSHAVDHSTGRLCVQTQPGATLHLTLIYCSGTADSSPNLLGARTAGADGAYEWDWIPETPCKGQATARVSASWQGQSVEQTFTVNVEDWSATPTPTSVPTAVPTQASGTPTPSPSGTGPTPTPTHTPPTPTPCATPAPLCLP